MIIVGSHTEGLHKGVELIMMPLPLQWHSRRLNSKHSSRMYNSPYHAILKLIRLTCIRFYMIAAFSTSLQFRPGVILRIITRMSDKWCIIDGPISNEVDIIGDLLLNTS